MQGMRILHSGPVHVHYGQIYARSPGCADILLETAFRGQANGLCGAGVAGGLLLMCGLHTGLVDLEVIAFDSEPPLEAAWPEVVEATFRFTGGPVVLEDWDGNAICTLPIDREGYMVRWCAQRFGEAEASGHEDDAEPYESYALQLWPSSAPVERIVRQGSEHTAYWHRYAQALA